MTKNVLLFILLFFSISSTLMGFSRASMLNTSTDNEEADSRMETILDAITQKNRELLVSVFSNQALSEAENLDEGIEYLFKLVKGDNVTFKRQTQIVGEKIDHGDKIKEVKTWFEVKTDAETYLVFLFDYTEFTAHKENIGLYALRFIKAEDEEKHFTFFQDMKIAGIFTPDPVYLRPK